MEAEKNRQRGRGRARRSNNRRSSGGGRGRGAVVENALNVNNSIARIDGYGQDAGVGDGLKALIKEINDKYDGIISDGVVAKWEAEHVDVDMLKRYAVVNVQFLRDTGLTMGGLERLKEHFGIDASDDPVAPQNKMKRKLMKAWCKICII